MGNIALGHGSAVPQPGKVRPALRSGDITAGVVESLKRFESAVAWGDTNST